jgi:DNA-binding NarL/FixJ family response regulator
MLARQMRLSPVLRTTFLLLAAGLSAHEVSALNGVTVNTVKTECRLLYAALNISCHHEIRDAMEAAASRCRSGASSHDLYVFLRLRFE